MIRTGNEGALEDSLTTRYLLPTGLVKNAKGVQEQANLRGCRRAGADRHGSDCARGKQDHSSNAPTLRAWTDGVWKMRVDSQARNFHRRHSATRRRRHWRSD